MLTLARPLISASWAEPSSAEPPLLDNTLSTKISCDGSNGYSYTIAMKLSIFLCDPDFRSNEK